MPEDADYFDRLNPGVWKTVSVPVLGSFLSQLDATIVNVSLESLAVELHSTLQTIQWVTSGYLLALALMLPLNGWLVERIGTKRLYLFCFSGSGNDHTARGIPFPVTSGRKLIGGNLVTARSWIRNFLRGRSCRP